MLAAPAEVLARKRGWNNLQPAEAGGAQMEFGMIKRMRCGGEVAAAAPAAQPFGQPLGNKRSFSEAVENNVAAPWQHQLQQQQHAAEEKRFRAADAQDAPVYSRRQMAAFELQKNAEIEAMRAQGAEIEKTGQGVVAENAQLRAHMVNVSGENTVLKRAVQSFNAKCQNSESEVAQLKTMLQNAMVHISRLEMQKAYANQNMAAGGFDAFPPPPPAVH